MARHNQCVDTAKDFSVCPTDEEVLSLDLLLFLDSLNRIIPFVQQILPIILKIMLGLIMLMAFQTANNILLI